MPFRLIDKPGLITTEVDASDAQKPYAKDPSSYKGKDSSLASVVETVHPNVLIGTSTQPGAFTESIVKSMASSTDRPIIFPLSNPTRLHEATPEDILHWTDGKALVATGSPFDPVRGPWGEIEIAECNNSVVFPGIGLGCVLSRAKLVTDKMLVAAVSAVSSMSPVLGDPKAPLLPDVTRVKSVSVRVARDVIRAAVDEGTATEEGIPEDEEELEDWIREQMWEPEYRPLKLVDRATATRAAKGELKVAGSVDRKA